MRSSFSYSPPTTNETVDIIVGTRVLQMKMVKENFLPASYGIACQIDESD